MQENFLVNNIYLEITTGNFHFSDSKIAIGLVAGILDKIIFTITIIGADKNIQTIHQTIHQKARANIITTGLKFNLSHINFGSTIFHINWSNHTSKIIIIIEFIIANSG
jgi:hypothetical protein